MGLAPNVIVRHQQISSAANFPLIYREYLPAEGRGQADILLVHGLASSGNQFTEEAFRFAGQGFRVLVPDLRGHGLSGVPQGPIQEADFAITVMAQDLVDMLDHAGTEEVHWVGNSLGGILALSLLGGPERRRLQSLALFGTCFSMDLPAEVSLLLRAAFLPGSAATGWITARMTTSNPIGQKAIATAIEQFNLAAGAAIVANVRRYDFIANARSYERPLLVLWGEKDRAVNLRLGGDIGKFVDRPNFNRIDLKQGGHCANFDMHEAFCTALETHWARAGVSPGALPANETL